MRFIVISFKKNAFMILFLAFFLCLIAFSESNLIAAKNGIVLWANSILPTIFPFLIATELLCKTNFIQIVGHAFHKFMKPIFNVPGESAVAIILGIISGYPIGAKIVCNLYENKICSKPEAERLIAFTNNSGPMFILGTVGIAFFKNSKIGKILLISHILSALFVGLVFRFWKKDHVELNYRTYNPETKSIVKISNLGEIINDAISRSIKNVLMIGGFVVLFSIIISMLTVSGFISAFSYTFEHIGISPDFTNSFLSGFIELTNGMKCSANIYLNQFTNSSIILASFLLGFGGISILLQIFSIISKSHISIKPYIYGKSLQAFFSAIITYFLILL